MRLGNRVLDHRLERGIEAMVGASVLLAVVLFGGVRMTELACVTGLLAMASVLWVARLWLGGSHRFLLHPILLPALGFVAYAAWTDRPGHDAAGAEVAPAAAGGASGSAK
jgi:hypothetical protein